MSERYTRLYSLPENQYALGAPLLIVAGALLKDNQTQKTLAQLKFRNLSNKKISAVKIVIDAFDISGKVLEGVVEYQYLDLNIARGNAFGQKQAVALPNAVTRSFTAKCAEVVFSDGTAWKATEDVRWNSLPAQETIENRLGRLSAQYRRDTSTLAKYALLECDDLWLCACGAINHKEEIECYCCYSRKMKLQEAMELEGLQKRNADYEKAETEKAEKQAAADAAHRAKTTKFAIIAVAVIFIIYSVLLLITKVIIPNSKYNDAVALVDAGQYVEAIAAFEALDGYKDSATKIAECNTAILDGKYNGAIALMNAGKYSEAISVFEAIEGYKDSEAKITECNAAILDGKYNDAIALMDAGKYGEAISAFEALEGYTDSADKAIGIFSKYFAEKYKNIKVGEYLTFGTYEQDNNTSNGKEDIEWLVLEVKEGKALIISKDALDCQRYNEDREDVTWETCTLRKWLNNNFIYAAFSAVEEAMIPTVSVSADENSGTNPGNATQDQVFLLSVPEVNKYFSSDSARLCEPTDYAVANGASEGDSGLCWWWLRSPGYSQDSAAGVNIIGRVGVGANPVSIVKAVRPAMWIDLNA